jgi:hypothetical protein
MAAPGSSSGGFGLTPTMTRFIAAILGAGLLAWTGPRVARAGARQRADLARAQATLATFESWRKRYEPAVAAESISWRRTLLQLQALGISGDERLALTRIMARAAEEAGLRDVRVLIESPDTTSAEARLSTEGVRRLPAAFSLVVEGAGNLQSVVRFLSGLPPSVEPTNLSLVRQEGRARHRLSLAVYELQFSHGPASLTTPLERRDPRRVGVARARS